MGIFRKKDSRHETEGRAQPDADFRKASSDDARYRREHRETSEANRFNDAPDASEAERGVPPEGEREPTES